MTVNWYDTEGSVRRALQSNSVLRKCHLWLIVCNLNVHNINKGVPQESIFVPLLFTNYMNNLGLNVNNW